MHPLLYRNEAGQIAIRWWKLIAGLAVYVLVTLLTAFASWYFLDGRFPTSRLIFVLVWCALPMMLPLHVAKRHAEGRIALQFSLLALLAGVTIACVLLAVAGMDRRAGLKIYAERARLEKALIEIVATGTVRVSENTFIQVKRPAFDDVDLSRLVQLHTELKAVDSPLTVLDVSGSKITDRGAEKLNAIASLEYCFLDQTGVTDAAVDALGQLPGLKVLSVTATRVTPARLAKLARERPELRIEPKVHLKLKAE